ncbi:TetR/AcrR family transcriptional regulator [Thermodesulfobacteriota bacterium]
MKRPLEKNIKKIVANAKVHKDAIAVKQLIDMLRKTLEAGEKGKESPEDVLLHFAEKATDALRNSPIHSQALMRALYTEVLSVAEREGVYKESLLEDLLFLSLRQPEETEKVKRKRQKNAKERILQAALDEFSEKGFYHSTIESIAERAGTAKGTVYRYFKTKEELFNALKESTITEFVMFAKKEIGAEEDILKVIEAIIKSYLEFFQSNSAFFKVLLQEHKDFGREFSEKFINELILALPGLKRRCWKASREGRLKQMNYFTVFYGIIGFLNGIIQKWLHDGAEESLTAEVETIKEVLFYGFAEANEKTQQTNSLKVVS